MFIPDPVSGSRFFPIPDPDPGFRGLKALDPRSATLPPTQDYQGRHGSFGLLYFSCPRVFVHCLCFFSTLSLICWQDVLDMLPGPSFEDTQQLCFFHCFMINLLAGCAGYAARSQFWGHPTVVFFLYFMINLLAGCAGHAARSQFWGHPAAPSLTARLPKVL